jgi:DNA-binding transcriptional regulator YhcF (GntR family)
VIVVIDPGSRIPLGEQLRSQLERMILSGELAAGTQLPAIRHLAADLDLAPGTVAKVYEELAASGYITTARRRGTVVADIRTLLGADPAKAAAELALAAEHLALLAQQSGLGVAAAYSAVTDAFRQLATRQQTLQR